MQINFTPKKLKEANAYVDNLKPKKVKTIEKKEKKEEASFFRKVFKRLFK